jgi:PIN domain nuclease of toxin-antitoxin system
LESLSMTYLLDTSTWIWLVESPSKLSTKVANITSKIDNAPFGLSTISIWEVAKKVSLGKLAISSPLQYWMSKAVREPFIQPIPLSVEIALESNQLPGIFHNDPADQIIVATARIMNLTILAKDDLILKYSHAKSVW